MRKTLMFLLITCSTFAFSQELARFSISPVPGAGVSYMAIPLDGIRFNTDHGRLAIYEAGQPENEIPSQLEPGLNPKLWLMFDNNLGEKNYVLKMVGNQPEKPRNLTAELTDRVTILKRDDRPVLHYHHEDIPAPEGAEERFRRSALIHPLKSPGGAVLTNIQPPDHLHHYGIWNPWTRTTIDDGDDEYTVDFWNLGGGQGRVQFGGYIGREQGPLYAGLKALHEHVSYVGMDEGEEKLAINEVWDVRVWETGSENVNIVDLTTTLNSPLPNGILFNQYRYGGGIGYRATEKWQRDNSRVLTSEGKTRNETDASTARWCIIEGETEVEQGVSGVLFLSHPVNRMHPEPMRMWNEDAAGGTGQIFFQFTPIRHNEWKIEPGKSYTLRYRMIAYDGEMKTEDAEKYWQAFASSPLIRFFFKN